jgi:S-adenosylmethionine decarboxylase
MFRNVQYSGKHMLCDIKHIRNTGTLNDIDDVKEILDTICREHKYTVLHKVEHVFSPQGFTILYLLSESHISVHTFPERNYLAFDLYTCRSYDNNDEYLSIYKYLVKMFDAEFETPRIMDRYF